jgi:predicted ArsR family transcriptional regulator
VSEVALEAGIPMEEAKKQLDALVAKGFAELRTRRNGSQAYIIPDFLEGPLEGF